MNMDTYWRCWGNVVRGCSLPVLVLSKVYCRVSCRTQCAEIPYSSSIAPFATPHGLNGIFISQKASIGEGCTLFHQVTIGSNTLSDSKNAGAPTLGRNVYVGAGAKIIGNVHVGDNVRVGANCVVTKNVPDNCTVVSGGGCGSSSTLGRLTTAMCRCATSTNMSTPPCLIAA